jgi:hypothetical protein
MIKNGLYSMPAVPLDGADVEVGGVLVLRDGKVFGGDSFVFYNGDYECSDGRWKGEMVSREHTTTNRPTVERVQHIKFSGTYDDTRRRRNSSGWHATYPIRCSVAFFGCRLNRFLAGSALHRWPQYRTSA